MNLLLLDASEIETDCSDASFAVIYDNRRFKHLVSVLRVEVGSRLKVGVVNGGIGDGEIVALEEDHIRLQLWLGYVAPQPSRLIVALALPRPPVLERVLIHLTALGIKRIVLFQCARVEKSYWSSHTVTDRGIASALRLGLEQSVDTAVPRVYKMQRFSGLRDYLSEVPSPRVLVAHPQGSRSNIGAVLRGDCCGDDFGSSGARVALVIGPEGGLLDAEVEALVGDGATTVGLGRRILRVEAACSVFVALVQVALDEQV